MVAIVRYCIRKIVRPSEKILATPLSVAIFFFLPMESPSLSHLRLFLFLSQNVLTRGRTVVTGQEEANAPGIPNTCFRTAVCGAVL